MNAEEQESKKGAIVCGIRAGRTNREIADFNNIDIRMVQRGRAAFNDFVEAGNDPNNFDVKRKKHSQRSDTHGEDLVDTVQKMVDKDPSLSMRKIAAVLGVSNFLVSKIVKQDLRYTFYCLRRGHFLTEATKATRLQKAKALLNELKHPPEPHLLIFFSDEKNFNQDQKVNRKNNRWICNDPQDVPIVMKTKFPATVMVFGVVSNEGHVMPPHVFEAGLKVNTEVYLDVLRTVVKPWMDQVADGRPYVWQQDGAPAHNSKTTQSWCRNNFPHFWDKTLWPPSSPDCNPLDYFVWGVTERDINRTPHNTKASLVASIMDVFANLRSDDVAHACSRFRRRLEAVIDAKGDFIL